jgi:acetolactate synthase I/II/III large subunit|tara:strand:+ start:284 stop:1936 length:1653 start_codon:yes stop_codon:yes gene_type:complete
MLLAEYIVDFLYNIGVRKIFMLSGTGSVKLDDAFARKKGMEYVCARHEATAVVMAEAVAKLKNKLGVSVVTTGPGGTNAIAGVVEAWVDSTPVLIISGQVGTKQYIKDRAFGIQGFNIIDNVKRFTKYSALVQDPNQIRFHLEKALHEAFSGRPGPVWLDIPMDLQSAEVDPNNMKRFTAPPLNSAYTNKDLEADMLMDMISESKRPLIAFGRGVKIAGAKTQLVEFLRKTNIPSVSARMANDVLPYSDTNYFGMGGIRGRRAAVGIMKKADLLITLGTSNCYTFFGNNEILDSSCKLAVVNIDENIFNRDDLEIDLGIKSDVKTFLSFLNKKAVNLDYTSWLKQCKKIKKDNPMVTSDMAKNPINSYYLAQVLSEISDSRHIFINDAGSSNYISSQALNLDNSQREITSGAFYTMGLTLPLAVGAATIEPKSQIIAITGDGSIELNIQELQTIGLNNLNIKIVVINNGGYASIRDSQDAMCGGRYTDDEQILNFMKIANAFNIDFEIIQDFSEIKAVMNKVFLNDRPTIIEVVCDDSQYMIQPLKEEIN